MSEDESKFVERRHDDGGRREEDKEARMLARKALEQIALLREDQNKHLIDCAKSYTEQRVKLDLIWRVLVWVIPLLILGLVGSIWAPLLRALAASGGP